MIDHIFALLGYFACVSLSLSLTRCNRMWKPENSCLESSNSTTTYNFVDHPPYTYSMKIQSLSQINTLFSGDKYESRAFTSGNYKWKLVIYPKGNKKDNGSGFISMYVELDTTNLPASTVVAYLAFYVYNKKENKYFTIQDVEGKYFNALRPMWGFPQVLRLYTFNDPKSGYLFEGDQCEFGVDVMVPLTNWEVVSFFKEPSYPKFSWTIDKFLMLKEHCYVSHKFLIGGRNWVLKLYPKGYTTEYSKSLSLFMHLADNETMETGEMVYMRSNVQIVDQGWKYVSMKVDHWYKNSTSGLGWNEFASLAQVQKNYLDRKGSLNIEIEFEAVSTNKYSP